MNWGVSEEEKNCVKTCEEYVFFGLKDSIQNNVISKGLYENMLKLFKGRPPC